MITLGLTPVKGTLRMKGTNVLLEPIPPKLMSPGGIHLLDNPSYMNDQMQWRVLAVGKGKHHTNRKTKVKVFVPLTDVEVGDAVLCKADMDCHSLDDGTGRIIVDAKHLLMKWRQEPETPAAAFGGDS